MQYYSYFFLFCFIFLSIFTPSFAGQDGDGYATVYPNFATVKTSGVWTVKYVVDSDSMLVGGGIKVRFVEGFGIPQIADTNLSNFISASTSKSGINTTITISQTDTQLPWEFNANTRIVKVKITDGKLFRGDAIFVYYGLLPIGLTSPASSFKDKILIASDLDGNGTYSEIKDPPIMYINPLPTSKVSIFSQSCQKPGEPFEIAVVSFDLYDNISLDFESTVSFSSTDAFAQLPPTYTFTKADSGCKRFRVILNTRGVQRISISVPQLSLTATSNPILVKDSDSPYKIYWGELHTHTKISWDGYGNDAFEYAYRGANLDFFAQTDHANDNNFTGLGISDNEWYQIKRNVVKYHKPGRFVTILGYEFSALTPFGHHNVYFDAPDEQIWDIPIFRRKDYESTLNLWNGLDSQLPSGVRAITIPHHTGNIQPVSFDSLYENKKYRRAIEIYSLQGISEYYNPNHPLSYTSLKKCHDCSSGPHYAQDAWAKGARLGVVASSDNHRARPDASSFGLTAVYAETLSRKSIFDAIINRRTYGTTGERIILDFSINGKIMGSELIIKKGEYPQIHISAFGTDNIEFIEVLKYDSLYSTYDDLGHPIYDVIGRFNVSSNKFETTFSDYYFVGPSLYYVRLKQVKKVDYREVWAWSSPIWVSPESISSVPNIVVSFETNISHNNIKLDWEIVPYSQLIGFEIQRNDIGKGYRKIGYIEKDSTLKYSFIDRPLSEGTYKYRLKVLLSSNEYYYTKEVMVNYKLPIKFYLEQNYPNPFNSGTTIMYGISEKSKVRLSVYNILGEEILVLVNKEQNRGNYSIYESFKDLPSGVYFYKLKVNESTIIKKMVIVR